MSIIGNYRRVSAEQVAELRADPAQVPDFLYDESLPADDYLDVDKAWHAIHFLLTGETSEGAGALYDAVLGGESLGSEDIGYGPARFLTPFQVQLTANALSTVPASTLIERFDPARLNEKEVYPEHWTGEQIDYDYVTHYYRLLVDFFRTAAENGQAMILYLN